MAGEQSKGTIVLAHGAWCDGSVWKDVLISLAHDGYAVHAAQLPLKSYEGDIAAVNLLLDHVQGPVLLVGHSYAGAVISVAGSHAKVNALAYIAGFAPETDEVFGSILAMNPAEEQMTIGPDASGYLWLDTRFTTNALGHDLHRGIINLTIAVQKATSYKLFESKLSDPAWKHKPSSYLVTTEDRILAPATQHFLAKRIQARTEEVAASHLVILSQAEAVANFIRNSAVALTQ